MEAVAALSTGLDVPLCVAAGFVSFLVLEQAPLLGVRLVFAGG